MSEVVMDNQEISPTDAQATLTQHAMLVVWGLYAQRIGLIKRLMRVKLRQKSRFHQPQTKLLEFFMAMLAGWPHLQDISRSAHPLDQDGAVAQAWQQSAWADYSGGRTMQQVSAAETDAVITVLEAIEQPFLEKELALACQRSGHLVYDLDLTGRPVSSTSTSYPNTAFGYMGDTISLGYQAVLVSMHSPSYGRLWLANQLHPGDTVSVTEAQSLTRAAERRYQRHLARLTEIESNLEQLRSHYRQLESGNATNPHPVRVILRIDAGFAGRENIEWLIEMGYDIYTKSRSHHVVDFLKRQTDDQTAWQRVGANAELVAWSEHRLKGCPYPLDVALERFYTGKTRKHSALIHYGSDPVSKDLPAWFQCYNHQSTYVDSKSSQSMPLFVESHLIAQPLR